MRIAIAAHSATRAGGVETYLAGVIPALKARGHQVACWFESTVPGAEPIVPHPHAGLVWIPEPDAQDPLQPLRGWRPDVIYLHGLRSADLERELTTVAPVAFYAHSYYGSCISGEKATRVPIHVPCDRIFGPACLAHYFPHRCGGLNPVTMMHQYSLQRAKQNLLREYAAVLVASNHMAREYARQDLAARIVSLPSDEAGSPRGISLPSSGRLLFLGRFERSKGVQMALRSSAIAAAGLNRPIHVVMAGQGTLADRLKREAAKLTAADRRLTIEWPGWLTESERHAALAEADLLLMPSVWPEPFGLVGVEAASAGVPSIAFNVGGIADWLSDGVNGRLVSLTRDRVQAFADAIIETLRDPAALARMRHNAVATARRFTMTTHVERLESVFAEVIARTANQSTSA